VRCLSKGLVQEAGTGGVRLLCNEAQALGKSTGQDLRDATIAGAAARVGLQPVWLKAGFELTHSASLRDANKARQHLEHSVIRWLLTLRGTVASSRSK
jgi:hypothetical protein